MKKAMQEVEKNPGMKDIADRLIDAFNRHDARALAALYAPDQVTTVTGEPAPARGRDEKEQLVGHFFHAFPDMRLEPFSILYAGDHIVFEVDARGTNSGPIATLEGEIPATGKLIDVKMTFVTRVNEEGLIAEDRTVYDTAEFLRQLGFIQ